MPAAGEPRELRAERERGDALADVIANWDALAQPEAEYLFDQQV